MKYVINAAAILSLLALSMASQAGASTHNSAVLDEGDLGDVVIGDDDDDIVVNQPDYVEIRDMTYAGTGCPAGSAIMNYNSLDQTFELTLSSMVAEVGPGVSLAQSRKACQILLDIDHTPGFQFALERVDAAVSINLDDSANGLYKVSTYFQGDAQTIDKEEQVYGPLTDTARFSSLFDEPNYSPCDTDRALNIRTELRLTSMQRRYGSGIMSILDEPVIFKLTWKPCE
jgi:hypothetical protein